MPYRFGIAFENTIEAFRGRTQDRTFSIEARYALADWNKIPLNPTLFVEWKFGLGNILHDEGPPEAMGPGEAEDFINEGHLCRTRTKYVFFCRRFSVKKSNGP